MQGHSKYTAPQEPLLEQCSMVTGFEEWPRIAQIALVQESRCLHVPILPLQVFSIPSSGMYT